MDEQSDNNGITHELIAEIADPVGFLMLNWAHIDQALSALSEVTQPIATKHGVFEKHQRQFSDKLTHVTMLFEKIDELQPFRNATLKALRFVSEAQVMRNAIIHGIIHRHHIETGLLEFSKVNPTKDGQAHDIEIVSFTITDFKTHAKNTHLIANDLTALSVRLLHELPAYASDAPAGHPSA
jgi:hypothetical protein